MLKTSGGRKKELAEQYPKLRGFLTHGMLFKSVNGEEAVGECPSCNKEKFYCNTQTGLWDCKACGEGGNIYTFLNNLYDIALRETTDEQYKQLRRDRHYVGIMGLKKWGLAVNPLNGEWIIPCYANDKLVQLYHYGLVDSEKGKFRWMATPNKPYGMAGLGVFGAEDLEKPSILVCEGVWDAITLWETLRYNQKHSKLIKQTDNPKESMLSEFDVVAIPGCTTFQAKWSPMFKDKEVILLFDNDHPKPTKNGVRQPALDGIKRTAGILNGEGVEDLHFLHWGDEEYHDEDLESGYDLGDFFAVRTAKIKKKKILRSNKLKLLFKKIEEVPAEWIEEGIKVAKKHRESKPCNSFKELVAAWDRPGYIWTQQAQDALAIMLACIISTEFEKDQLWFKLISPPSTGKSDMCNAFGIARNYVLPVDKFTGFHSGTESKDGEDRSLIAKADHKCMIIKDGDTVLKSGNKELILSEGRDLYDGNCSTYYRNSVSREYDKHRMTWIIAGTSSLRELDDSEVGQRFLDCIVMDGIDTSMERKIGDEKGLDQFNSLGYSADTPGKEGEGYNSNFVEAQEMTAGYIEKLCGEAAVRLREVKPMTKDHPNIKMFREFGTFVAYLRARPSKTQREEVGNREMGTRVTSQLSRLAKCLTVVLNKNEVDDEVMRLVLKVALDTSRGRVFQMFQSLKDNPNTDSATLSKLTDIPTKELNKFFEFFRKQKAIIRKQEKSKFSYRLSKVFSKTYDYVMTCKTRLMKS